MAACTAAPIAPKRPPASVSGEVGVARFKAIVIEKADGGTQAALTDFDDQTT